METNNFVAVNSVLETDPHNRVIGVPAPELCQLCDEQRRRGHEFGGQWIGGNQLQYLRAGVWVLLYEWNSDDHQHGHEQ